MEIKEVLITKEEVDVLLEQLQWEGDEHLETMNMHFSKASKILRTVGKHKARLKSYVTVLNFELRRMEEVIADKIIEGRIEGKALSKAELERLVKKNILMTDERQQLLELEDLYSYLSSSKEEIVRVIDMLKASCTNLQSINKNKYMR